MNSSIDLTDKYLTLIQTILLQHLPKDSKVWLFGSRATHTAKPYSDIDLAIEQNIPLSLAITAALSTEFEESALPYKVDIVDWHQITPEFKAAIDAHKKLILIV